MRKSKKFLGMMMALALVICSNGMTASATTITTDVYSGVSAYTYYVRKSEDSSSVLLPEYPASGHHRGQPHGCFS